MNLLIAASRYPVVLVAMAFIAIALLAYAMDWFVGRAEREDAPGPRR